jgi:hypothetical protein
MAFITSIQIQNLQMKNKNEKSCFEVFFIIIEIQISFNKTMVISFIEKVECVD